MELLTAAIIAIGLNLLLFIPAFIFKTDKLTDLSYALSFFIVGLVLFGMSAQLPAQLILLLMIFLWSLRLGTYLFIRIRKIKRDKRFDGMRESFPRFLRFWLLQGISVFLILIPSAYFFSAEGVTFTTLSVAGLVVWALGLLVEAVADYQKYTFINNEAHKGKWIDSGLWKYSQHPNYFGEITLWLGVYLFTLPALSGASVFIAFISPLYIATIILFVSGIPLLDKGALKLWGDNPAYLEYRKRTSKLILWFQRKNEDDK